jgi:hexokinase
MKNKELHQNRSQIINIESGNFGKASRSELDLVFDNSTMNPGNYTLKRCFQAATLAPFTVLKAAAAEGVFSQPTRELLNNLTELSSNDASNIVGNQGSEESKLKECFKTRNDEVSCKEIIDSLIERASKLVASNIAAVVLKTGKGKSAGSPILITIEGTTFYKLHNLKDLFEGYLEDYLSGERKRYVKFTEVAQSSLIGAALAALID